jgi:hypothetical protein
MALEPIDGTNPHIYSLKEAVSPYSFVDDNQAYNIEAPPPCYLHYDELNIFLPTSKESIFEDLEFCNHGGLRCVNEEAMDR